MKTEAAESFTPAHHALLFAWLSRAVIEQVGRDRGERVIRKAIRRYGEERGLRMALRAQGDGNTLSMTNYMAYGEWKANPEETEQTLFAEDAGIRMEVHRCPWHRAWEEAGIMEYGRLYCLEIDTALARGFNPELTLEVNSTLSNDGRNCEFVFRQAEGIVKKKEKEMPWPYHLGHLYWTMSRVIAEELGEEGQQASHTALERFTAQCGREATLLIESYRDTDFRRLPEIVTEQSLKDELEKIEPVEV